MEIEVYVKNKLYSELEETNWISFLKKKGINLGIFFIKIFIYK